MRADAYTQISFRAEPGLKDRLEQVTDKRLDIYAPSQRQVLARGLELALQELEAKKPRKARTTGAER